MVVFLLLDFFCPVPTGGEHGQGLPMCMSLLDLDIIQPSSDTLLIIHGSS